MTRAIRPGAKLIVYTPQGTYGHVDTAGDGLTAEPHEGPGDVVRATLSDGRNVLVKRSDLTEVTP